MARAALRERDVEALNHLLEKLADVRSVVEFQKTTVESIPSVVPSDVTAWNEVDPASGSLANPVIFPEPPAWQTAKEAELRQAFASHMHEHPVVRYQQRTGDGRPRTISDFLSQESFHGTMLYQSCYSFLGTEDQLAIGLPDPNLIVAITLTRGWQEFDERDRLLMNLMRPHIVQGLRNAQSFDRVRRLEASLDSHLEESGEGLVFLTEDNHVEYASATAVRVLTRWLGNWQEDALPQSLGTWITGETGPSSRFASHPVAPPWPLILQRDGRQLTIRRIPSQQDSGIVLVVTERTMDPDIAGTLARLGLTARQIQVLELAIRGRPNASISRELGISTSTVESHMTLALARLGVESRTAAASLIFQATGTSVARDGLPS
jgi:DNA-binding CsgD family transcriptional regulator